MPSDALVCWDADLVALWAGEGDQQQGLWGGTQPQAPSSMLCSPRHPPLHHRTPWPPARDSAGPAGTQSICKTHRCHSHPQGSSVSPCVPSPTCPVTTTHISALLRFRASVMISCSRTETSSAGVAVKGQGPQPGSTALSSPLMQGKQGEGLAQGPSRKSGGHRGTGAVWGICTCEQHMRVCSSAAAHVHTCF